MLLVLTLLSSTVVLYGCGDKGNNEEKAYSAVDANNSTVGFDEPPKKVVALEASIADIWLLSGGTLSGVTSDYDNYNIALDNAVSVGSSHSPNAETVAGLNPDLVLYNPKKTSHITVVNTLKNAKIAAFAVEINSFEDYLYYLHQFTALTGNSRAYDDYGNAVDAAVAAKIAEVPANNNPEVLLLRAYSSGINIVARDNFVINMLDDLGAVNIAKNETNALEALSMEYIVKKNPKYIFIVYMGSNVEAADAVVRNQLSGDAWEKLDAVKNERVYVLNQSLFHYKPNENWATAYTQLFNYLYPEM